MAYYLISNTCLLIKKRLFWFSIQIHQIYILYIQNTNAYLNPTLVLSHTSYNKYEIFRQRLEIWHLNRWVHLSIRGSLICSLCMCQKESVDCGEHFVQNINSGMYWVALDQSNSAIRLVFITDRACFETWDNVCMERALDLLIIFS